MRLTIFNTPIISQLLSLTARLLMKICGWTIEGQKPTHRRFVMIGAPHTSNWDLMVLMGVALSMRTPIFWLGKSSLFRGPCGPVMRYLGGIPVHRERKNNLVGKAVSAFTCHDRFVLALSPEGTRTAVNQWRTGFWHIANQAKVPIIPAYADLSRKIAGTGSAYKTTGDMDKDIANLQAFYAPYLSNRLQEDPTPVTDTTTDAS